MNAPSDPQLLLDYAERRSEAAFAELVSRHIDLVHSTAVRLVNDAHLAKDVSQAVFVVLANDAGKLAKHPVLSGWLHRTTRNIASQMVRTDVRRRNREQAAAMNEAPESNAAWKEIAPHLDAALGELSTSDRDAVLLRYFENKPARDISEILGINTEAAQKRVSRAVEKLRDSLAKRGITAGAAGLVGILSANAVQAAPVGISASISSTVFAGTVASATKAIAMTTLQKALAATAVAVLAGTGIYQVLHNPKPGHQIEDLRQLQDQSASASTRQQDRGQNRLGLARNSERLLEKNRELERQNAVLKEQRIAAEKSLELAREQGAYIESIAEKFFHDDELEVPESVPEIAALYGQARIRSKNFYGKWNGRVPSEESPEAAEYQKELDACVTDDAILMKALTSSAADSLKEASGLSQFQSFQIQAALGLNEPQLIQLRGALDHFYEEATERKLRLKFRPIENVETWHNERDDFGKRVFTEIQTSFTPQQRSDFARLYGPDFFWGLDVGSQRPKN